MKYTVNDFNAQFPNDAACLEFIFQQRFPQGAACPKCHAVGKYTRVTTRKCYACSCGHQISPTEGTIFHKSRTSLKTWFHAIFLVSASKNGVAALELMRLTGVTYKTAWRMGHQIRKLMKPGTSILSGVVEADETWVGGVRRRECAFKDKTPVVGVLERGGEVRAEVASRVDGWVLKQVLDKHVSPHTHLITDEHASYPRAAKGKAAHSWVTHSKNEYVRGGIHTNAIEGFWSQLKRSVHGTYHQVSRRHLQAYVNEFAYRYNRRKSEQPVFSHLSSIVAERRA